MRYGTWLLFLLSSVMVTSWVTYRRVQDTSVAQQKITIVRNDIIVRKGSCSKWYSTCIIKNCVQCNTILCKFLSSTICTR
jgi:hypothetical protein